MIVSPDILRKELLSLMAQIDAQIVEIERAAETRGVKPTQLRDNNGWVMIPLLVAKVTTLSTLVNLNQQEKDRRTTSTNKKRRDNG